MDHPLFSAQEAKREAIERVERNASLDFLVFARTVALRIASAQQNGFTTDAIWEVLDAAGVKPPEPRALGAVMQKLAREGLIRKTGEYVDSCRAACHGRPVPIWTLDTE